MQIEPESENGTDRWNAGRGDSLGRGEQVPAGESQTQRSLFRTGAWLLALLPIGLLGVARTLEPSHAGLGTHQQLGLPPCSMRVLFGIRCPGCGMTTSWAHFTRGDFASSFRANFGGFLLACLSMMAAPIAIRSGWRGDWPSSRTQRFIAFFCVGIATITIAQWLWRLLQGA